MVDGKSTKRKKFHDRDKYYRLAKEQGLRSRAAFKLSQINRKFNLLQKAKVVLDLCAAPGGWTQVCARSMMSSSSSSGGIIVAVDILPIRAIANNNNNNNHNNNVITLIGDITTERCKGEIRRELQGASCDVVLCDGAPNVGASYDRDAYAQNEIALHALQCATQHLRQDGSLVVKLYRSRDYSSYLWVAHQLFRTVQAVKPSASRSQSAEIFLVCQQYLAPAKIDARLLDPRHVFEEVAGDATGGGGGANVGVGSTKKFNIFHKSWDSSTAKKSRSRQGYDLEHLDASMRRIEPVRDFIESSNAINKDPIQLLSCCTGLAFVCDKCRDEKKASSADTNSPTCCRCQTYLNHALTTPEIKACVSDLKVLNKGDFKGLLTWRLKLREAMKNEEQRADDDEVMEDNASLSSANDEEQNKDNYSDAEEEQIQAEIEQLRQRRMRERKRAKKKEREAAATRRRRAAMGMDLNALDVPEHDEIFSLATITSKGDLEAVREVDLDKVRDEDVFPSASTRNTDIEEDGIDDGGSVESQGEANDLDEKTGYDYRLDRELDDAYDRYLTSTKGGKSGTKMAKRSKKLQRQKALEESQEDEELVKTDGMGIDRDTQVYAEMLQGPRDSDDDSSEEEEEAAYESDDGFGAEPLTPEEHAAAEEKKKPSASSVKNITKLLVGKRPGEGNPLIHTLPEEPTAIKTARWFSNPLFESIESAAQSGSIAAFKKGKRSNNKETDVLDYESEDGDVESMSSSDDDEGGEGSNSNNKVAAKRRAAGISAEEVLATMPKTDKQKRHERRLKETERQERKRAKRALKMTDNEADFEVAPARNDEKEDNVVNADERLSELTEKQRKKVMMARELIKAEMGAAVMEEKGTKGGFEVVSAGKTDPRPLPVMDTRKYDSENEDYDSDDYAKTLALGTMMLRRSKAKALVDASYNRFAWNDPQDLPDWFVDDENRHYRPQLPIPPELVAKMKEKMLHLSTKPIAKVAEARARKNRRANSKLAAAKKKAEAVANSSEMSESMKLKAISKAMRGQDASRPSKTYVVSKKGRSASAGKGVKLVDKRMKNDKRSMDRSSKKRKKGKQGGLSGSKKRRHHK